MGPTEWVIHQLDFPGKLCRAAFAILAMFFLQISFLQHIQGNLLLGKLTTTYKPTGHGTSIINNGQIIHVFIVRPTLVQTRILTLLQIFPWQSYVKSRPDE